MARKKAVDDAVLNDADTSDNNADTSDQPQKEKFMELGALWKAKSGNGWVGQLTDGTRVLLMENQYKTDPKHPVFRLFVLPVEG